MGTALVYATAAGLVAIVGLVAMVLPARHAGRIDASVVLQTSDYSVSKTKPVIIESGDLEQQVDEKSPARTFASLIVPNPPFWAIDPALLATIFEVLSMSTPVSVPKRSDHEKIGARNYELALFPHLGSCPSPNPPSSDEPKFWLDLDGRRA